jgi:uncharacterized protein YbjT (DUF2867 family)
MTVDAVFVTGGTGYLGRPLIEPLLELQAVAAPPGAGVRIVSVPEIRRAAA